jgi:hypothetical protein
MSPTFGKRYDPNGTTYGVPIGVHAGSFVLCLPRRVQVGRWEPLCRASSVRVSCPQ